MYVSKITSAMSKAQKNQYMAKGQAKAVHQRYFDAKSPYWHLQRADEHYPVET